MPKKNAKLEYEVLEEKEVLRSVFQKFNKDSGKFDGDKIGEIISREYKLKGVSNPLKETVVHDYIIGEDVFKTLGGGSLIFNLVEKSIEYFKQYGQWEKDFHISTKM
jgi:hypothetical protein